MAHDDRDRSFEKALAQQLRSSAQADAQNAACPDAETLAAYHERELSLEELSSWKTHIAACARCQEILAQLELTDNIPVGAGEEVLTQENILGVRVPEMANAGPGVRELPRAAAASPARVPVSQSTAAAAPTVATLPPPKAHWRWTAPLGAIAAGLLVWVVLRENKSLQAPPPPAVEIAANHNEALPTSPAQPPRGTAASAADAQLKKETHAPSHHATTAGNRGVVAAPNPNSAQTTRGKELSGASAVPVPAPAAGPATETESPQIARELEDSKRKEISSLPTQGRSVGAVRAGAASPAPRPPAKSTAAGATTSAAGASRAAPLPPLAPADAKQESAATQTVTVTEAAPPVSTDGSVSGDQMQIVNGRPSAGFRSAILIPPNTLAVSAPGGRIFWRVGLLGTIERTADAGKSWKPQKSGVTVDLLAGSAPSNKVCWLVGRAGTILWTKNGGKHWLKLAAPVDTDLRAVNAADDLHATVADATGKTFATIDGGKTWTPAANP
jgi:hypothetical protein